jgi:hypothetical protein
MSAHRRREGVRGVDDRGDPVLMQIGGQPVHAAEAADANLARRQQRGGRAAGQ